MTDFLDIDEADAVETANEEYWKDLAREFLDAIGAWDIAKMLSLLLEQEYKRGYNAGITTSLGEVRARLERGEHR